MTTNFEAQKIRLIFVADVIPRELRRVVEFLNKQMNPAEVLALELGQFSGENGLRTLLPSLYGQTEEARSAKSAPRTHKTLEQRLEECENDAAKKYFTDRLTMPRNSQNDAIVYRLENTNRWYVTPLKTKDLAKARSEKRIRARIRTASAVF